MANNKYYLEQHPDRKKIINALIKGDKPQKEIARQYGLARATLTKYLSTNLAERAAEAVEKRRIETGEEILDAINEVMDRARKMYDACDEYLTDPDNPGKYFLGPRADEVDIVYEEPREDGSVFKGRDTLQNILKKAQGLEVSKVRYKHADPRELLLKAATVLNRQLAYIAEIQGLVRDQVINIYNNPQFVQLQQVVLKATEKHPEARESIVKELEKMQAAPRKTGKGEKKK